jgi:integrase
MHGESRSVPMNNVLTETLRAVRMTALATAHVFFTLCGEPCHSFRTAFERAVRKAGLVNFTLHDLRHIFASRLVMHGVDLPTVKELLGHKTIAMTLRYTHLSSDHKQRAVRMLEQVLEQSLSNFHNSEHRPSPLAAVTP